jgi:hypothetical protein
MAEDEQVYEGFLIVGVRWAAFVCDIHDLENPNARYWVKYDRSLQSDELVNVVRSQGKQIDWPSKTSDARIIWVKFIGEEVNVSPMLGYRNTSISEIDKVIRVKSVVSYSSEQAEEAMRVRR